MYSEVVQCVVERIWDVKEISVSFWENIDFDDDKEIYGGNSRLCNKKSDYVYGP